jgi:hypothetical protein
MLNSDITINKFRGAAEQRTFFFTQNTKHMTLSHQITTEQDEVDIVVDYDPKEDTIEIVAVCFGKSDYTDTLNQLSTLNFVYEIDWRSIYNEQKQQFEADQLEDC